MDSRDVPEKKAIRFGISGCGAIGPTHAGALAQIPGTELTAFADIMLERAGAMAQKFGVARVYKSHEELISDPNIDCVCVCTPSGMHAEHAISAMRAGKHVVIEKPMDITLEACDRIIEAQKQTGRVVSVICQHRFDTASRIVKDLLGQGKLGRLVLATAEVKWYRTQKYYDSGDWRGTWQLDGGGALMNQGVHTVDLLQWLAGDVVSVSARVRTSAHERIEVEDVAVAALEFSNGALGTIVATTAAYEGLPARIDLFGTEGSAIIEGDRLKSMTLKSGERFTHEDAAAHAISVARGGTHSVKDDAGHREKLAPIGAVWGDAHRAQLEDFLSAVRHGRKPLIDPIEARKAVAIIVSVYESSRTGQFVPLNGSLATV